MRCSCSCGELTHERTTTPRSYADFGAWEIGVAEDVQPGDLISLELHAGPMESRVMQAIRRTDNQTQLKLANGRHFVLDPTRRLSISKPLPQVDESDIERAKKELSTLCVN